MLVERLGGLFQKPMHLAPGNAELAPNRLDRKGWIGKPPVNGQKHSAHARRFQAAALDQRASVARRMKQERDKIDDLLPKHRALFRRHGFGLTCD